MSIRDGRRAGPAAAALLAVAVASFWGCEQVAGKGGGTETESKLASGRAVNADGSPAVSARIVLRPADYLTDPVFGGEADARSQETFTDAQGRYSLRPLPAGDYRIEGSGAESGGFLRDFNVPKDSAAVALPADTVQPRGSIRGWFAPDSDGQLASFVQVYGMERLVLADRGGAFVIPNLPAGKYDLRLSSLEPFRRAAVRRGIAVASGLQTSIDTVALEREAKLSFSVDANGLKIDGVDSTNPVIFDNERWDNGVDDEYVFSKASAGSLDLRGEIVTVELQAPKPNPAQQLQVCKDEIRNATLAGFTRIPDPSQGALAKLIPAASGRVEDIVPAPSAGSDLIVAEARKATPDKPLVVVVGGPLTTVANAYLTDPAIATRMVVAGVLTFNFQPADSLANYLVSKKCRFVEWGRNYVWAGTADTASIASVPLTRMGTKVRAYLTGAALHQSLGDLAPMAFLFRRGVWTSADMVKITPKIAVTPASDLTFDFIDIPSAANAWPLYNAEFFSALENPAAYHPLAAPGRVEAEAYQNRSAVTDFLNDSLSHADGLSGFANGGYADYKLNAAAGNHAVTVHYRAQAGAARIAFGQLGQTASGQPDPPAALGQLDLPAAEDWSDATLDSLSLPGGTYVLRLSGVTGSFDLDWVEFK